MIKHKTSVEEVHQILAECHPIRSANDSHFM